MKIKRIAVDTTSMISMIVGGKASAVFECPSIKLFATTEFNLEEVHHLIPKLSHRHGLSERHLNKVLEKLKISTLEICPKSVYKDSIKKAISLIGEIDETQDCRRDYRCEHVQSHRHPW